MKIKKKCGVCGCEFETYDFLPRNECDKHYKKPPSNYRHKPNSKISYFDGSREKTISKAMLKEIKSGVRTANGEFLSGKKGRKYLDNHSKKQMGKDLAGSYLSDSL